MKRHRFFIDTREVVEALVPQYAKGETLDIGGGTAKYRSLIEPVVSSYLVADLHDPAADVREDVRGLSFPDESFDTVLCFQVLEHVDDTDAAVRELYRVLRPGGSAIVTVPFLFPEHGDPSDFFRFTLDGARAALSKAGFSILESGTQGSTWSVVLSLARILFLYPYAQHGRARRALWTRLFALCKTLDRRGFLHSERLYANVYLAARKP